MMFKKTSVTALFISISMMSWTGKALAQNPTPPAEKKVALDPVELADRLEVLQDLLDSIGGRVKITGAVEGEANATLDLSDKANPSLVIDVKKLKFSDSVIQALREQLKADGATTAQTKTVVDTLVAPPTAVAAAEQTKVERPLVPAPPPVQPNLASTDTPDGCKAALGFWDFQANDGKGKCVTVAKPTKSADPVQVTTAAPAETTAAPAETKTTTPAPVTTTEAPKSGASTELTVAPPPPAAKTPDAPAVKTPDAPAVKTPDAPAVKSADAPAVKTPDAPAVKTADAPAAPETTAAPAVKTPDAPAVKTADAPVAPDAAELARLKGIQDRLKAAQEEAKAELHKQEAAGNGTSDFSNQLRAQIGEASAQSVRVGEVVNGAVDATGHVVATATGPARAPAGPAERTPAPANVTPAPIAPATQTAPADGSFAQCWVDKDSKLDMKEATHNGVEGWVFTRPGEPNEQFLTGSINGRTATRAEMEALIANSDSEFHKRNKFEITVIKVKHGLVVGTKGVGCTVKRAVWDRSLKPAGKAVAQKFTRGHFMNTILRTPVIFAKELLGPVSFWKRILCFGGKWIIPVRPIAKRIRNSKEKTGLHNRLDGNDNDFEDLVTAATKEGLLTRTEAEALFQEQDQSQIDVDAVWYTVDEAPRKGRGSMCTKGTGETGHPELEQAIDSRYSPQGNPRRTISQAIDEMEAAKKAANAAR
jgi:hypothetical protein